MSCPRGISPKEALARQYYTLSRLTLTKEFVICSLYILVKMQDVSCKQWLSSKT